MRILFDLGRGGDDGGEGGGGIGADGYGDFHAAFADLSRVDGGRRRGAGRGWAVVPPAVFGHGSSTRAAGRSGAGGAARRRSRRCSAAILLALPVHAGGLAVVDLHAVHAHVALAGSGIAGDDAGQGDEAAAVLGPGCEDGELVEVD